MISKREGLLLYWCEGSKTGGIVAVTNGDYRILRLFMKWLEENYGIKRQEFKMFLHLWKGKEIDEETIINEWLRLLSVERNQFRRTWFNEGREKSDKAPLGICRARINNKLLSAQILHDIESEYGHENSIAPLLFKHS